MSTQSIMNVHGCRVVERSPQRVGGHRLSWSAEAANTMVLFKAA